eukprot:CAMPEP_0170469694 /NCGR_PEP_ID=MMETSP0123-20130129/12443_1 /TAXON_ID=182087 /ORGANISM="Favella ehrenbergii, Strain Fehren 1" /LENGTH=132 /DNA_ID=CAMNT_0010736657 /DNA_START=29 /DNA_END=427 /DNA_ORIENTATION=+
MSSGWEGFVHMIEHRYNKKKQSYTKTNVCENVAIYGRDGTAWAVNHRWPGLHIYEEEQDTENGTQTVMVNEWEIVDKVSNGTRQPGIRIGKEKYSFVRFDPTFKSAHLAKNKGGATLVKTNKAVIIGTWTQE